MLVEERRLYSDVSKATQCGEQKNRPPPDSCLCSLTWKGGLESVSVFPHVKRESRTSFCVHSHGKGGSEPVSMFPQVERGFVHVIWGFERERLAWLLKDPTGPMMQQMDRG